MTDRELLRNLSKLKQIEPDASWLKANRDSLFTQISNSGGQKLSAWSYFIININSALKAASAPAVVLASLLLAVFASGAYSHLLFSNVKPTDSLYIAREISEKAKLNTVIDQEDRQQLASQFAVNNAKDIAAALSDPNLKDEQEVAKLSDKFNEEIKTVQTTVDNSVTPTVNNGTPAEKPAVKDPVKVADKKPVQKITTGHNATDSDEVFTAADKKDQKGVSIDTTNAAPVTATVATSTKIVQEAQNLFLEKKYKEAGQTLDKLNK
jgi:hypothetical protein